MKKYFCVLLLVIAILNPCFAAAPAAEPPPLKIGLIYSLSGPAEIWGSYGRQGAELAAKEINEAGGVAGRKIQLLLEDSKTSANGALSAYQKLVKVDKVDALVGDVWDFVTNPLVPLSARDHVVLISPAVIPDAIESRSEYFYTMGSQAGLTRAAVDKFFELNPQIKSIAIICWDNPWGRAYDKVWTSAAEAKNIKVIDHRNVYGFDYDYRTEAAAIAQKRPDAVIMGYQEERIIKRLNEQNFHPLILSTSNLASVLVQSLLPSTALEGAYFTDWQPASSFVETFTRNFNRAPMFEAHNHYQAIKSLAQAFALNPANLNAALRTLKFAGVAGEIDFSRGFAVNYSSAVLNKVENNKIRPVGP
ncbi:MAG: ABC transporter substrate-binding protein [Oligoflexia bacterium]|nr:ABC transporter substrate-binding protein [Oligoflexia bacterium]